MKFRTRVASPTRSCLQIEAELLNLKRQFDAALRQVNPGEEGEDEDDGPTVSSSLFNGSSQKANLRDRNQGGKPTRMAKERSDGRGKESSDEENFRPMATATRCGRLS